MIFVDTSAFYALVVDDDSNHGRARQVFDGLAREAVGTHSYVLCETVSLLHKRAGPSAVSLFDEAVSPRLDAVIWVDEILHRAAASALVESRSKRVSFVDLVSFEVMRRNGIEVAFAFDADFAKAGFTLLR